MFSLLSVTAYFWLLVGPLAAANDVSTNLREMVESALEHLVQVESLPSVRRDPAACSAGGQPLELTDYSGWFVSPNYPDYYPNDANCNWLIRSQEPGGVVVLDFNALSIEAFYDGLVIFDGPTTAAPPVAGFDGVWNSLPTGIRSTGDSVLVWFFSDSTIKGRGFNVSYTSDVTRTIVDPCYPLSRPLLINDYSGSIQSNNYPSRFWGYSDCSWLIESQEPGGTVQLVFKDFAVGSADYLYLYDGPNAQAPLIAELFGNWGENPNLQFSSTRGYMFARFVSDRSGSDRGFSAEYTSVPQPEVN